MKNGLSYNGPQRVAQEKPIPEYAGQHVWIVVIGHHIVDPTVFDADNKDPAILDAENYVGFDGPFCQYCKASYPAPIMGHCLGKPPLS